MSKSRQSRRREAAKQRQHQRKPCRGIKRARSRRRAGLLAARELRRTHYGLRSVLAEAGQPERDEWAGIPMPLDDHGLIVEPRYPKAKELMGIGRKHGPSEYEGWKIRNTLVLRSQAVRNLRLSSGADGTLTWGLKPGIHHFDYDLQTLGAMDAWGLEQEQRALQLFATMVRHRQMKQYVLTGMFLEHSERSQITYLFRRLKPTVAMKADREGNMRILAALCAHPIAYYSGSWAGAMCPTDDVIAHLAMMRGDEHLFWKRCSQHEPHRPEAGL
jgi:hypothetical protein